MQSIKRAEHVLARVRPAQSIDEVRESLAGMPVGDAQVEADPSDVHAQRVSKGEQQRELTVRLRWRPHSNGIDIEVENDGDDVIDRVSLVCDGHAPANQQRHVRQSIGVSRQRESLILARRVTSPGIEKCGWSTSLPRHTSAFSLPACRSWPRPDVWHAIVCRKDWRKVAHERVVHGDEHKGRNSITVLGMDTRRTPSSMAWATVVC